MNTSPSHACDNVNKGIKTLSVHNCIFCYKLLNGKAKILECLHVVCYECIEKKIDDSGLKCKCLTVTGIPNGVIVDYPILSSSVPGTKLCDFCHSKSNAYCVFCKKYYCGYCSKVHLSIVRDRIHSTDLIVPYPMTNQLVLCSGCSQKNADVYCTQCSMMLCHFCHSCSHLNHNFKILNDLHDEVKINLSEKFYDLKENDDCLKNALDRISKVTQKLETQKNSMLDEINAATQKLHLEIIKRSRELKKLVEHNFKYSVDTIKNTEEVLQNNHKKFKYDLKLIKTVMSHNNVDDLMKLSKIISKKLEQNKEIVASGQALKLEIDMKFNDDESIDNCISAINNAGSITLTPVSLSEMLGDNRETPNISSDDFINPPSTILNYDCFQKESILTNIHSSSDSDSSEYESIVDCSCCNQWAEWTKLIQCKYCDRYFHHDCHIPAVPKDKNIHESSATKWKCTLCKDLGKYARILNQRDLNGIIPVGTTELIIMERILMELYCQNYDSEHYRELPDINIYPFYYKKIPHPLSLNDIKNTLESNPSYTSLIQFLLDLKKVFSNGLSYYSPYDPYYRSAVNLQFSLQRLINKWIPKLSDDTRLR